MHSLFAALVLVCFVFLGHARDYTIEVNEDQKTNTIIVIKDSAISHYSGKATYQGEGADDCSWVFCATRSFRGVLTEHGNGTEQFERLLTETEGCLLIHEGNITDPEGTRQFYGGSVVTEPFPWNAEGEFYLNGQLLSGECAVSLTVTGSECDDSGEYGFQCDGTDAFPVPEGDVDLVPSPLASLVFAGLTSSYEGNHLGQLKMVLEVVDTDSDGMGPPPSKDLGSVRLLLNGIPTEDDYDFEVPLMYPQTELSIAAARRDSDYFYAVQATENVTVNVETVAVVACDTETYGPNCSITAAVLRTDEDGEELDFDPATDSNCYSNICYFFLEQKNVEVTVTPSSSVPAEDFAVLYKTNNFPTLTDYDVATPGATTFVPDFFDTDTTAQLAVFASSGQPFTILLGKATPIIPIHPDDDDDDNGAPWAWIGVSIALGVIIVGLIIAGVVYYVKTPRTYVTVQ